MNTWQPINKTDSHTLTESRLQLHYGIQFIAATGAALAEPLPDYSHTSLEWNPALNWFMGTVIRATQPFQVAIDPVNFTLILVDTLREPIAFLPLQGKTMAEGLKWLKQAIFKLGADASKIEFLDYPPDDFPIHPLAHGATFNPDQPLVLAELANYYGNTHQLLQEIASTAVDATTIRIWPHHFDIAILIMLPGTWNGSPLTVGVGLSPGDASYPEPYWYVSPYPYPDTASLPAIAGNGSWHTQHWVGAVLPVSHLVDNNNTEAQQSQVEDFLKSALQASMMLLSEWH